MPTTSTCFTPVAQRAARRRCPLKHKQVSADFSWPRELRKCLLQPRELACNGIFFYGLHLYVFASTRG